MADLKHMTLEEWRSTGLQLGNGDYFAVPFVCPLCKHIATPRDFKDAGADPNRAPHECIGRVTGAKGGLKVKVKRGQEMPQPCDWAAFGLFGTLKSGVVVIYPDGHKVLAFDFGTPS